MAKKMSKGKKLDVVVREIAALKVQIKKLVALQTALSGQLSKLAGAMAGPTPKKPAAGAKAPSKPSTKRTARAAPVLVRTSEPAPHTGRAAAQ